MSRMNSFVLDVQELGEGAVRAAEQGTAAERLAALTEVFGGCGERANKYPEPTVAVVELVRGVIFDFQLATIMLLEKKSGRSD
ncbi:hypothetical protein AB0J38_41100 [Streptomyces sp. NPDC050095]|uniref:hypothetical protein n=1 Tax=unclassified Streptomyces TaxID=2593676 RepID=UPI0034417122